MTIIKINGKEITTSEDLKQGNLYRIDGTEFVTERVIYDLDECCYICETRPIEK